MGLLDSVNEIGSDVSENVGRVGDALSGGSPTPARVGAGPRPQYYVGAAVDPQSGALRGRYAPHDEGVADGPAQIEFVHFGHTHTDTSDKLDHAEPIADDDPTAVPAGTRGSGRGVQFRAALHREALCVAGFVSECRRALEEYEASKGSLGATIEMAGSYLGGGAGGGGPKPADLDTFGNAIQTAVAPILAGDVDYPKLHRAGLELHAARSRYSAYLDELITKPPGERSGGGSLGALGGLDAVGGAISGAMGPAGDIVKIIQGIGFKTFDAWLGVYTRIAQALETHIAEASRELSIVNVRTAHRPIYDAWRDAAPRADGPADEGSDTGIRPLDSAVDSANDASDAVQDFFTGSPRRAQSSDALDRIFRGAAATARGPSSPPSLADLTVAAFQQSLGVGSLPGFLTTLLGEVMEICVGFLSETYAQLLTWDARRALPKDDFCAGGRERLLERLVGIVVDKVDVLQDIRRMGVDIRGLPSVSAGQLMDRGMSELNDKLGAKLDPVLRIMLGHAFDRLEAARQQVARDRAGTMEVYLGILPGLLALVFRGTFFPIWGLLVDNTFGRLGFLSSIVDAANGAMRSASERVDGVQDKVDDVRDYGAKAAALEEASKTGEPIQLGDEVGRLAAKYGAPIATPEDQLAGYKEALKTKAERDPDDDAAAGPRVPDGAKSRYYPLGGRAALCTTQRVTPAQIRSVAPQLQQVKEIPATHACPDAARLHTLS